MSDPFLQLNGAQLMARLDALAKVSETPDALTRLYLTPAHAQGIALVGRWMREAGMTTRVDGTGSLRGTYKAALPDAPILVLGSHIDTVCNAGKFDGNLGVLTAIAVVDALHRQNKHLPFSIVVAAFGDEEGVRFPSTLAGSKALAGRFSPISLDEVDAEGVTRRAALVNFGVDPTSIAQEALDPAKVLGYVEVHIEQGPVLEAKDLALGIVTAINGASRGHISISGVAGHAGTLPMDMRRDALATAAEIILAIEQIARATPDLVATIGQIEVPGGAVNVVPGGVKLSLDVRAPKDATRHQAIQDIEAAIARIALARGTPAGLDLTYDALATPCDASLMARFAHVMQARGLPAFDLPSGAGHDAMAFRGRIPVAMLFVRSKDGISHNPAEYSSPQDIGLAAQILYDFVIAQQGNTL